MDLVDVPKQDTCSAERPGWFDVSAPASPGERHDCGLAAGPAAGPATGRRGNTRACVLGCPTSNTV